MAQITSWDHLHTAIKLEMKINSCNRTYGLTGPHKRKVLSALLTNIDIQSYGMDVPTLSSFLRPILLLLQYKILEKLVTFISELILCKF